MADEGQSFDGLPVDGHLYLDEVRVPRLGLDVVVAGVTCGEILDGVVEVRDHLCPRQQVLHGDLLLVEVAHFDLLAAPAAELREQRTEILCRGNDGRGDHGLEDLEGFLPRAALGPFGEVVDGPAVAVLVLHQVGDGGRRDEHGLVVLVPQTLMEDLHVEQPQEAAAQSRAERAHVFPLHRDGGVIEAQPGDGAVQVVEAVTVHGQERCEDSRDGLLEARERLRQLRLLVRRPNDGVPDQRVARAAHARDHVAHLAAVQAPRAQRARREHAHLLHAEARGRRAPRRRGRVRHDALALLEVAVDDLNEADDAAVLIEPAVHQQSPKGRVGVALRGRRDVGYNGRQHVLGADIRLGGGEKHGVGVHVVEGRGHL
mmetsp:Transcript_14506/g.43590  ORF Transcript_14506/g.43590 Transcript_14506/m.43590 type:complete len:372 (+) Transcript_14506:3189-4304(+)